MFVQVCLVRSPCSSWGLVQHLQQECSQQVATAGKIETVLLSEREESLHFQTILCVILFLSSSIIIVIIIVVVNYCCYL